ncbi:hypothetical protein ASE00_16195 [Sphingomonas sp. Root710]|uniref:TetR/AcrR family transcriptional regulator n=1 Tax=Sphingomonas sp. Root710 TaxID=1736594 RepID=UPI0007014B1D|nr:TetR/AcrR family transcriptional regulator [Sphingomonas sp. Root710]KRB80589.1 hypothetical protein ASE00_16195 [Sphingomonas sp. Root710]
MTTSASTVAPLPDDPSAPSVRDRLIDVAARHFAEHGIQGASQRAIQREVGVNNSTANYYFGSKDALYRAVVDTALSRVQARRIAALDAIEALSGSLSHEEHVRRLLRGYLGALLQEASTDTGYNYIRIVINLHLVIPEPAVEVLEERLTAVRELYVDVLAKLFPNASRNRIYEVVELSVGVTAMSAVQRRHRMSEKAIERLTEQAVTVSAIAFETLCGTDAD